MQHIKHFIKNIKYTGALLPSSRYLAKDMVHQLKSVLSMYQDEKLNILEIGPGTGVFTREIHKLLGRNHTLDIVELNSHFYKMIRDTYSFDNVQVFHGNVLDYDCDKTYDFIISSLPYESIPESISEQIWEKKLQLSHPGSYISYYKYVNFNRFRCKYEKDLVAKYQVDDKLVFRNLPPARLLTLQITDNGFATAEAS